MNSKTEKKKNKMYQSNLFGRFQLMISIIMSMAEH